MDERIISSKFSTREDRTKFIYDEFKDYIKDSVLDVGCYRAFLKKYIPEDFYIGIDIAGEPNIKINLEKITFLPFKDNSFQCVICADVLEHLDNLHSIFGELFRVSKKYVIISLPNCWRDARVPIERGYGSFAHYGLPLKKPIDRHKWFFNTSQAVDFIKQNQDYYNYSIEKIVMVEKPKNIIVKSLRKLRYPKVRYLNRYIQTIIFFIKKN